MAKIKVYQQRGTYFGVIREINIKDAPIFVIYDNLGNKIECYFAKKQLDKIEMLIGKEVNVTGKAIYKGNDIAPYKIEMDTIEKYQESDIDLSDLYGAYPDWGGGKDAVELIREIRDAE